MSYTLSRAATVTFGLQRSLGRGRYSRLRRVETVEAKAGTNTLTLSSRQLGRRAGLYRLTARLTDGTSRPIQFRIRRA